MMAQHSTLNTVTSCMETSEFLFIVLYYSSTIDIAKKGFVTGFSSYLLSKSYTLYDEVYIKVANIHFLHTVGEIQSLYVCYFIYDLVMQSIQ